jgi:Cu2+-exporting ATPase
MLTLPVVLFSCRPFLASAWRDISHGRVGMDVPVALGILVAFGASSAATWDPSGPWGAEVWYDSLTMFVFFLLTGRVLEQRLRSRTAGALESLARRLPDGVDRLEADGSVQQVPAGRLRIGDRIRVRPGQAVAADGVVESGESRLDEALLTGESAAVARRPGDLVIAGSHNLDGLLTVRVTAAGAQTRYAAIVALMERAAVDKPQVARIADRLAGPFLLGVMLASVAACVWWWPADPAHALGVAIAVLIVTCPCALSLATPAATLAAAGALARRGVLVRNLHALESGATVDTVVFDKTGTLTQDRLLLQSVQTRPGADAQQALALGAALAQASLHPLSRALAAAAPAAPGQLVRACEHPGQGLEAVFHDGEGTARMLRLGAAGWCGATTGPGHDGPQVHLADGTGWLARFDFEEALRADAPAAIDGLRRRALALELLSGDHAQAVTQVAVRLGIDQAASGQSPEDKLLRMRALQAAGHRVAMVGDGMNDGPVLARADLSIAMGQDVPIAQARADVVVPGGQLSAVAMLLAQAGRTRAVVRQNLAWAAAYNAACVPLAVIGWMPPWLAGLGMAASSLLVVANSARLARIPD